MRTYIGRNLGTFLELMLFSASKSMWLCSPRISPKFARKLVEHASKGIDVKVITGSYRNEESVDILRGALRSNVNLDYLILKPEAEQLQIRIYLVDGRYAVVGSANLTESDLYGDIEYVIIVDDLRDVERIMEDFITLWRLYSELGGSVEYTRVFPKSMLFQRPG